MTDETTLLPCPFCGGEAEMLTAESMNGGYLFGIMCNDCRSRGDVYDTEAEAIAAWNARTAHGTLTAEQVEIAINNHCQFTVGCVVDAQAITDELNARAERTCKNIHEPPRNNTFWPTPHFKCSECKNVHVSMDYVYYCPNCGCKVIGG